MSDVTGTFKVKLPGGGSVTGDAVVASHGANKFYDGNAKLVSPKGAEYFCDAELHLRNVRPIRDDLSETGTAKLPKAKLKDAEIR